MKKLSQPSKKFSPALSAIALILATTVLTALPVAAYAEWYVGAGGGLNIEHDADIDTPLFSQNAEYDNGWGALATAGYKFNSGIRTELEFSYRDNDIDSISVFTPSDGSVDSFSLMANVLYDVNTGSAFKPYIGVGAGASYTEFDKVLTVSGGRLDDSELKPAVQGIVGVSYGINRHLDFFTQYQFQYVHDMDPVTDPGVEAELNGRSSLVTAGLRWNFGVSEAQAKELVPSAPLRRMPEPAPAPVAAEPAADKYMVFFDFNRSDLTVEAASILDTVAQNAKNGKVVSIDLTGHADRAGSEAYNMRLSQRRAETVKKHLARLGVPMSEIATHAKGETDPLVPTNDGVREPQNRRVEILYGK